MGKDISLFSGYSQKENRTTNYCLLMLKQLYEESPKHLADALENMGCIGMGGNVGVQFRQQERRGRSIPDGLIWQSAFSIFVETKNSDWFYWNQINKHVRGLRKEKGLKVLIALANMEEKDEIKFEEFQIRISEKYNEEIRFLPLSFEKFIEAIEEIDLPPRLKLVVEEFRSYLDTQNLLPTWTRRLDVVNCVTTMHEVESGVYLCPATSGSYWHSRAKFFGPYRRKTVDRISEILGMVDVIGQNEVIVHYDNGLVPEGELKDRAVEFVERFRSNDRNEGVRVILLGEPHPTMFLKDTKGGMLGTKRFFEVGEGTAGEIAEALDGKSWSEIKGD